MCDRVDFFIKLYNPILGKELKSNCMLNIFNNKYNKIYKLDWCKVSGENKDSAKNGAVILDQNLFLDINVNLSFVEKCDCGIVFMKNNDVIYARENNGLTLNFNISNIFRKEDKLQLLILTNSDIDFFDYGCNWYLGGPAW
ncbi:MAG: hypothetical protein QW478_01955 [Candidatus Micrarchaeaceae archaeon]